MTAARTFARYVALPVVAAGILGGAALGLAGMANAGTYSYQPEPRPGIVATPSTYRPSPGHRCYRVAAATTRVARFVFGNPSGPANNPRPSPQRDLRAVLGLRSRTEIPPLRLARS